MQIQCFFDINVKIVNDIHVYSFISNGNELTELRMLLFLDKKRKILNRFCEKKIKKVVLLYDIDKLPVSGNFSLFTRYFTQDYVQIFKDNRELLSEKLFFTVIKSENTIFHTFFKIFKKFYIPIKPLYLCESIEEAFECIDNEEKRKQLLIFDVK